MHSAKDFFLNTLGISVPNTIFPYNLLLQRPQDDKPFGAIMTEHGKTFLRVGGDTDEDGVVVELP